MVNGLSPVRFRACPREASCLGAPKNNSDGANAARGGGRGRFEVTLPPYTPGGVVNNISADNLTTIDFVEGCAPGYTGVLCLSCVKGLAKSDHWDSDCVEYVCACGACEGETQS